MKNTPLTNNEKLISCKIAEIQKIENDIPAVLIVFKVCDGKVVYMSKRGRDILGITNEEIIAMGTEYHQRYFNPEESKEYTPKIIGLLERNNDNEIISAFQQVRSAPDQPFSWYITGSKIILKDEHGTPLLFMAAAIPIDSLHELAQKAQRILDENKFLKRNYHLFEKLTKREIEILKLIAKGISNEAISHQLFISEETVETHRKNIKRKLNCKTTIDCSRFAIAFDLI
jgi:DNA-binding CsgD family transcriptional regulator